MIVAMMMAVVFQSPRVGASSSPFGYWGWYDGL